MRGKTLITLSDKKHAWDSPKNCFPKGGGKQFLPVAEIRKSQPKNRPFGRRFGFSL
jgi:hypothetical protein